MEKLLLLLFLKISFGIFSQDVRSKSDRMWWGNIFLSLNQDSALEQVFDITKEDHLNIELAEAVGVTHLAVSYPQVWDKEKNKLFIGW